MVVARIWGLPCAIYAHGEEITTWRQPAKFRVMRFLYRNVERVIANSDFTRDELLKLGADACVSKPVGPRELIMRIHDVLERRGFVLVP